MDEFMVIGVLDGEEVCENCIGMNEVVDMLLMFRIQGVRSVRVL